MKKIIYLLILTSFTNNTYGIKPLSSLKNKGIFFELTAKNKSVEEFTKTISENTNYRLTGIHKPNIAEKVLIKRSDDAADWFSVIFIYSLLNEVEEQLILMLGKEELNVIEELNIKEQKTFLKKGLDKYISKKDLDDKPRKIEASHFSRFLKIYLRAHIFIKENGKIDVENLERILYENAGKPGKRSYFTKYIQKLFDSEKIITPSLITCLKSEYINMEATIGFVRDFVASLRIGSACEIF
jgi:hypothetical protein